MDHQEAVSLGATEGYLLGTLDEEQREAFEEHFFGCLECAEDVRAGVAVVAVARTLPDAPTPVIEVAPTPVIEVAPTPVIEVAPTPVIEVAPTPVIEVAPTQVTEVATSRAASRAQRRWFRSPQVRSYAMAVGGLAAGLCIAAYQGFVVIPRLEDQVQRADTLQTMPSYFLSLSRGEATVVAVSADDRQVALTLSRSWDRPPSAYRVELQDASGRTVFGETLRSRLAAEGDELEVLLPVRQLPAGSYVLVVEGVDDGAGGGTAASSVPAARYSFHLRRR